MPDSSAIVNIGVIVVGLLLIAIGIIINILSTKPSSSGDNPNNVVDCDTLNENLNVDNKKTAEILILSGYAVLIIGSIISILPNSDGGNDSDNSNQLLAIITLIIVLYKTIVTGVYFNKLIHHDVANEYYTYEGLSKILLFVQAILLCVYISSVSKPTSVSKPIQKTDNDGSSNQIAFAIITLFLLNITVTAVTNNILAFFSTDG